ncbi:MAG: MarR family winged helix-turn-helix transcriptional regulator [Pseudomonadota bacterium]
MVDRDAFQSSFFPLSEEFRSRDFPFYWIARLNAKYSADMDALLKPKGLSSSKWRILMILHEHGRLSMSDIAIHAVAKLSTITKIVYKMQEAELVLTSLSSEDRRVTEVTITARGEAQLKVARDISHRMVEKAFQGIEAEEVIVLNRHLSKIFNNLNSA